MTQKWPLVRLLSMARQGTCQPAKRVSESNRRQQTALLLRRGTNANRMCQPLVQNERHPNDQDGKRDKRQK